MIQGKAPPKSKGPQSLCCSRYDSRALRTHTHTHTHTHKHAHTHTHTQTHTQTHTHRQTHTHTYIHLRCVKCLRWGPPCFCGLQHSGKCWPLYCHARYMSARQKFTDLLVQLSIFLIDLLVGTFRLSSHARLEAFVI